MRKRFMGFFVSGVIFPRIKSSIRTGTSVTPRRAAKNMEKVLVNARGLNRRPSWASRENTGMKLTVMTRRAKKRGRPTLLAAAMITHDSQFLSRHCQGRSPADFQAAGVGDQPGQGLRPDAAGKMQGHC